MPARANTVSLGRSHPVVGWIGRNLMRVSARLPLWSLHAMGAVVGNIVGVLPTRSRSRSLTNLGLCFPELSPREHRRIARRAHVEMCGMVFETGALWRWNRERILGLVRRVHGQEHMDAAMATGRGVILASPHLGSWETVGLYISANYPMTGLYRPSRVRQMDSELIKGREHLGAKMVPAGMLAVRTLRRALAKGGVTLMLPDTDPKAGQSVFAPFFGVPANTGILISRLAHDSGATVLFSYAERLPRGRGYELHFVPTDPEVSSKDKVLAATHMNLGLEAIIRRLPEQYLWRYRRFKRRPGNARSPYDKRSTGFAAG